MTSDSTWLLPGTQLAAVSNRMMLLVAGLDAVYGGPTDHARLAGLEALAEAATGSADVLDYLSGGLQRGLPDFALVLVEPAAVRVVVRGPMTVQVDDRLVDAGGVSTWVETVLPPAERIEISMTVGPRGADSALPMPSGVVRAGVVSAGGLIRGPLEPPVRSSRSPRPKR